MNLTMTLRSVRWLTAILALPLLAACGDDEEEVPPPPPPPAAASQYAIVTQTAVDGASVSYIVVTDTVDHTEKLSLANENAIEVTGRAVVSAPEEGSFLRELWRDGHSLQLTEAGVVEKGATVSFAGRGVQEIGEYQQQFRFISETKAYFFDASSAQVIIWNPTDMTVTGVIPFNEAVLPNTLLSFSAQPLDVANQIIIPMAWRPSTGTTVTKQAGVLVVNPSNDSLKFVKKNFKESENCGWVRDGVVGPNGQIYLSTEAYGAASYRVHRDEANVLKPCLLKFDPQSHTFDDTFFVDLTTLTNGISAGSVLQGPAGKTYLRVLDEASFPSQITADTSPRVLASAAAWKWWDIKLDTLTATPVATLPAAMGSTFLFPANDRMLFTNFTSNGDTELRELTDPNGKVVTVTTGRTFSFLQIH
ncbi:hypothetical protein [Stigmatella aurantiaca]|uniref:MxcI n=1 Tax=Stigmatella aurantiaca (strain DW4/3-1) TaxID=378806 RepID=Q08NH9_STIAD|nr:hypothetical protein [Stigmatella aurantiaca]EAU62038.1 MxcI [Stigmatella aurantiaca DW4/3-1]